MHGGGASHLDRRLVAVVARVQHDDLFTGAHYRMDGVKNGFSGTAGDGDFGLRIGHPAVAALGFFGNRLPQRRDAGHHRILVMPRLHCAGQCIHQARRHWEVRKALAQIDRAMLRRQLRHHGKNSGANLG